MRVVITAEGESLDADLCPAFGRSPYMLFVDTETDAVDARENPAARTDHGTGIAAARFVVNGGATVIVTGRMGPNAWDVCKAAGITVYAAGPGSVQQMLDGLRAETLERLVPGAPGRRGRGRP